MLDLTQLSLSEKIDILKHSLDERYESMHAIRKRVQETGVWVLGAMLAAAAWIISVPSTPTSCQKAAYLGVTLISASLIRWWYISDLAAGFKAQQRAAARIEAALGLFSPGVFATDAIYESQWRDAGTQQGEGSFFKTSYLLIYAATVFLAGAILLKGVLI